MKLAITIPYYKKQFFSQTLQSLKNQTDQRFNLYIGNDASPEDPEDLIEKYLEDRPYKYIKYQENLGGTNLAMQWERVILETQEEEWIMILGDDDFMSPNVVECFYKSLEEVEKLQLNLVKYSQQLVGDDNKEFSFRTQHPKITSSVQFFIDRTWQDTRNSISENIFRRSAYEKYRFKKYPLAWPSDDMAWLEFTEFGNFYFIDEATFYLHSGNYNISGTKDNLDIKNKGYCLFIKDIILQYDQHFHKKDLLRLLKYYEINSKKYNLPIEINLPKYYLKYGGLFAWILALKRNL